MAPVVWGDRETIDQMLWYTLILLPLTLLPAVTGAFGVV
jgi:protoheme IX farnesyltransferase